GLRAAVAGRGRRGDRRLGHARGAGHAVAVALLQPLVGAALWLTGGAGSYMAPVLVLPMLYVAYFFPPRLAWPLAVLEIGTYASPLRTDGGPHHLLPQRTLGYGVS